MDEAYPRSPPLRHLRALDYDRGGGNRPLPTDGTDPKLARWLQSRIDEALLDGPATPRPDPPDIDDEPTNPGLPGRRPEPLRPLRGWQAEEEEDADDVETVLGRWSPNLEDDVDPATVKLNRMPVAFIGESVMDDHTVQDVRAPAVHWREETANRRRRKIQQKAEELVERLEVSQSSVESEPPRPVPLQGRSAADQVLIGLSAAAVVAIALVLVGAFLLM